MLVGDYSKYNISIPFGARGPEVSTLCPECSHLRKKQNVKCLRVNIEKGTWLCQHCGWTGGIGSPPKKTYKRPAKTGTSISSIAKDLLVRRGIPESVLLRNKVSSMRQFMPAEGCEVDVISFQYFKDGEHVNTKYRGVGCKSFSQVSGAEKVLYKLDDIKGEEEAIICEGEIDALSVEVAGFKNCVSVPDGAPSVGTKMCETKFNFLDNCADVLDGLKRVVIAVDNDPAGVKLKDELIKRFGAERCWHVEWPEGCKDANEVLTTYGPEAVRESIVNAKVVPVDGIFDIEAISADIDDLYINGAQGGVSTGWVELSRHYTVRPGEWTIMTGIPSHGKSSVLDALTMNLATGHGWKFAVFSPENQPLQRHFAKLAALYIGKPFEEGPSERMSWEELTEAKRFLQDHYQFILPSDDDSFRLDRILDKAAVAVMRFGVNGVIIDPWNELEHSRSGGLNETEYISRSLSQIRRFARAHKVHVWLVAHPTKMQKGLDGKFQVPTLYDVAGSAHFYNKADCGLSVWRDPQAAPQAGYNEVEVHVQKVRFKEVGSPGVATIWYQRATGRFLDPADAVSPAEDYGWGPD